MMNKLLMIVDPQIDFIDGSLPVTGALDAMEELSRFLLDHTDDYQSLIVTLDWHPYMHSSFITQGGEWPQHCVQHSVGAAIWPSLFSSIQKSKGALQILLKGENPQVEEYSIFNNSIAKQQIQTIVKENKIERIDICGLAGDICVLNTLKDGVNLFGRDLFNVLTEYSPSLDGGKELNDYLNKNKV